MRILMPKYYTVEKIEISDNDKKSRYDDHLNEVKLVIYLLQQCHLMTILIMMPYLKRSL